MVQQSSCKGPATSGIHQLRSKEVPCGLVLTGDQASKIAAARYLVKIVWHTVLDYVKYKAKPHRPDTTQLLGDDTCLKHKIPNTATRAQSKGHTSPQLSCRAPVCWHLPHPLYWPFSLHQEQPQLCPGDPSGLTGTWIRTELFQSIHFMRLGLAEQHCTHWNWHGNEQKGSVIHQEPQDEVCIMMLEGKCQSEMGLSFFTLPLLQYIIIVQG